jgi:hypothetical protein
VLDACPGAIAPGAKNETAGAGDLSLTPLFGLLAIHPNQSELVYGGVGFVPSAFCDQIGPFQGVRGGELGLTHGG